MTGGKRICIVEDDDAVRQSLKSILEMGGYTVSAFETGEAFLAEVLSPEQGVLILDIDLPGISGWQVLEKVDRASWRTIVITGRELSEAKVAEFEVAHAFEKPVRPPFLLDLIKNII